jgi:hypothetical protein
VPAQVFYAARLGWQHICQTFWQQPIAFHDRRKIKKVKFDKN